MLLKGRIPAMPQTQVSCTITFDPETEGKHLTHALDYFQYQLKGVSFLPRIDYGAFPQVRSTAPVAQAAVEPYSNPLLVLSVGVLCAIVGDDVFLPQRSKRQILRSAMDARRTPRGNSVQQ